MVRLVTVAGGPRVRAVVVGVAALALAIRRQWWSAGFLTVAVGGAGLANTVVKMVVQRRRPAGARAASSSFPSGHASGSLALLGAAAYLAWRFTGQRFAMMSVAVAGLPVAALVGLSRILLREHHPGDVLGGYALGAVWLALTHRIFAVLASRR